MVEWHHQLDRHEFAQALGAGDGQGSLASCSPLGRKELDTTELSQSYGFASSHVWMYELDHKEG